ncbi:MAG: tRNA glutamyl-Q(34) synthetase GluQRS [Desulfovibrio sp.]|jgi:glutamyl-tRNA synthetase|nr:tRNA glutamyl-Q(34) synthetase GluQRS [Desulfovibrio sp.]
MQQHAGRVCGRLAPSPTGHIHLGNAWAFLLAWLSVRSRKGRLILRVEDIDPQRSKGEFTGTLLEDLRWFGLDWDEGPDIGGPAQPYLQSLRMACYEEALARLEAVDATYPCFCTRRELRHLASAPHVEDMGTPYPGTCRRLDGEKQAALFEAGRRAAVRLRCSGTTVSFVDGLQGEIRASLADCGGDFALRRSDGVISYQLAVTVDDALMGVTDVVRGRDILPSTPRQIVLQRLLGYATPVYRHIPLLLDNGGNRLAKRHQSLTLRKLRQEGVEARRVVGLLSHMAGLNPSEMSVSPQELLPRFAPENLPKHDQCVTEDNLRRLVP